AGRWLDARRPFEELIAEFPDGTYSTQAEDKLAARADYYAVKLAEYAMPDVADNYAFSLEQQGLHPYIREVTRGTKRRYVVLVGGFAQYDDARVELARMKQYAPDAEIWP
ncbi:MAG: SPOR domain-containing protein, partial [Phycisphaerae bacterium]